MCSLRSWAQSQDIELELILVDDGSTDGSSELCDRLCDKVIHQSNSGVSAARNEGIKMATGEWLWFVDADDYIESIENGHLAPVQPGSILDSDTDLLVTGFIWDENGEPCSYGADAKEIPYNLWRCWFKRENVKTQNLRFVEKRKYAEDQEFILRYLMSVKKYKAVALPSLQYHYTLRPGSAMTRKGVKAKKFCDIVCVIGSVWRLAICRLHFPSWIWVQTRRLMKTALVISFR